MVFNLILLILSCVLWHFFMTSILNVITHLIELDFNYVLINYSTFAVKRIYSMIIKQAAFLAFQFIPLQTGNCSADPKPFRQSGLYR